MNLDRAKALAERIVEALRPHCERIEIAGSIRRERAEVNDIDLVLIPKDIGAIVQRVLQSCILLRGGLTSVNIIAQYNSPKRGDPLDKCQVDLFIAHNGIQDLLQNLPTNFGTLFLCRTGSMQHNIALADLAKSKGWHWDPYRGVMDEKKQVIASATEEEVYEALGLRWREPAQRDALRTSNVQRPTLNVQ